MKCKKIQEIILTDYIDGQLNEKEKSLIDRHLAKCQGCERFSIYVRKNVAGLFANMERQVPSEIVWRRIKGSVEISKRNRPGLVIGLFERLKGALYIPKPATIFATALTSILVVSLIGALYIGSQKRLTHNNQKTTQDIDYFQELLSYVHTTENPGFGTVIEENFL